MSFSRVTMQNWMLGQLSYSLISDANITDITTVTYMQLSLSSRQEAGTPQQLYKELRMSWFITALLNLVGKVVVISATFMRWLGSLSMIAKVSMSWKKRELPLICGNKKRISTSYVLQLSSYVYWSGKISTACMSNHFLCGLVMWNLSFESPRICIPL